MATSPRTAPTPIAEILKNAAQFIKPTGAEAYELYFEKRAKLSVESKDQKVESISQSEDAGLSVRLIKNGRAGFSFTTSLEPRAIERAIKTAAEVADVMPVDPNVQFNRFADFTYRTAEPIDAKGLAVPVAEKIELAKKLERVCRESDKRIAGVRSAAFSESFTESGLLDSRGQVLTEQSSFFSSSITCKAEAGGDSQMGGDYAFSRVLSKLDIDDVGRMAAQYATELLGAGPLATLTCPAVFRNSVVADLLDFISGSFSAEQVEKGRSMLATLVGHTPGSGGFSKAITLFDDATLPGGAGTGPFDGEGTPTQKTPLITEGVLQGFLYDSYYARKAGKRSTGNAMRGIKSAPSIGVSNLYIQKGEKSLEGLCDGISRGVMITDLMGVHTANAVTGDFSLGASGILIENGKLTRPVRGFAVAGNVLELFRKMTDTASDLKFFGGTGAPSVRISELSIGGA